MDWAMIILPALFAGLVAIAVTVAIERWGGRTGGVLGTLPSTIVPAAIGIYGQSSSIEAFHDAMFMTPAGILLNAAFLLLWRGLPPKLPDWGLGRRLGAMIVISLVAWFVIALLTVVGMGWVREQVDSLFYVGLVVTLSIAGFGVWASYKAPPAPKGKRRVGPFTLLARGVLAALAIAGAIALAAAGGGLAAGLASVFPAIFITTMVSLWWSQGEAVQSGAVGPMMLGATSVATFAMVAAFTLPAWGSFWGTVSAWVLAAGGVTLPSALWLRRLTAIEQRAEAKSG